MQEATRTRLDNAKTSMALPAPVGTTSIRSPFDTLSQRYLVPAMALLATLPAWICELPLGTDIPQHAAQISLALDHFSGKSWSGDIYINYATPYLLTYLVGTVAATLFGIVTSVKILISLYLCGTVLATARLLNAYGSDRRLAIFSIFGLYGFTYQWGFLPFNLSAVLLILLLAEIPSNRAINTCTTLKCLALAFAIVLTHGLTAVVAGGSLLILAMAEASSARRVRNYLIALVLISPVISWHIFSNTGVKGFGSGIYFGINPFASPYYFYQELSAHHSHWINGWGRLSGFFPRILGWENGTIATLAGVTLLATPFLLGYRWQAKKDAIVLNCIVLAILLTMPSIINGSLYSAERFSLLFFCCVGLLIKSNESGSKALVAIITVSALAWITQVCLQARQYNAQISGLSEVIAVLPGKQHALFISYSYRADGFIAPILLHSGQWYGVLKNGLVDPSFAATDLQPIRYLAHKVPYATIGNGFDWSPSAYSWPEFQGERYQAYIIHGSTSDFEHHTGCKIIHGIAYGNWLSVSRANVNSTTCNLLRAAPYDRH